VRRDPPGDPVASTVRDRAAQNGSAQNGSGPAQNAPATSTDGRPGKTEASPGADPAQTPDQRPAASEPPAASESGSRAPQTAPGDPPPDPDALDAQQGRHRRPVERQASYREVFAVGEFRALWAAQVLSYAGDQFAQVAIAILVYERTGSAFLTALAYALTYLPPIIGGPLLAGLADLFPRRRIMIICDLVRTVLVAGMAIPGVPFGVLCVLLFATVLLGPPFSSARSALLPDVLPGDKYVLGSAIGNMTFQTSQIVGFVAGAAVVTVLDPSRTLALDSVSFLLSAIIVTAWVKRRPAPVGEQSSRPTLWSVARHGAVLVFSNPLLRSLVLFGWLAGFYVIPEGLAAPYAHALGGTTFDVGLVMAAMPVGTVIGAFTVGRLVTPSARLRAMGWLAMLSCAPLIGATANPPLWGLLVLLAVAGFGGAFQLAAASAFVQSVPDAERARAFGLAQSGLLAVQGLGILIGGAAAQAIGPHLVVGLAGLLGLTSATILAMGWTHRRGAMIASMRSRSEASQDG
jgi:MFS family permease